jgi:DNA-binding IclR family transcriptional regulator
MNPERYVRTFDVLDLLVLHPEGLRLSEVSQALGAPLSSTHNLLQTMTASEVATVTDDLRYTIGPRCVRLGMRIINSLGVRSIAHRHLEKLARTVSNDVYLAVRGGQRVFPVDRFAGPQPVTVNIRLGDALALHATAAGKLFSAYHPELRKRLLAKPRRAFTANTITTQDALVVELDGVLERGYAVSREEALAGVVGMAVPVFDADAEVIAAIHVSALSAGMPESRIVQVISEASVVAGMIEMELGTRPSGRSALSHRPGS